MTEADRLRPHPKERLADPVQRVALTDAIARLRAESHHAVAGHRQVALVRHGPVSLILFVFERDGAMKEHKTDGEVTIHVLGGQLSVTVGDIEHALGPGEILSLAPGLPHSLFARVPSEMLLTVCRSTNGQ